MPPPEDPTTGVHRSTTGTPPTGSREATAPSTAPGTASEAAAGPDERGPSRGGRRRLRRRPKQKMGIVAWLALAWVMVVVLGALFADLLPLPAPNATNVSAMMTPPLEDPNHLLGTDGLGRDLLSRIFFGARVSLIVAFVAVIIGMTLGGVIGLVVGYFRGKLDTIVMGFVDVMLAFPGLVLLLTVIAFVGRSLTTISVTIGLLSIPIYTRVSRANTMAVASREFVTAAKAMGARTRRVLFREIAPNVILPLSTFALISVGVVIVLEGALSFLGLSIDQPTPTWGGIMNEGRRHLAQAPFISAMPAIVMFLTVLSLNLVGDKLRARFDVKGANL